MTSMGLGVPRERLAAFPGLDQHASSTRSFSFTIIDIDASDRHCDSRIVPTTCGKAVGTRYTLPE
jgi:hypothetical protein